MNKRILSLILITVILAFSLFGCKEEPENHDKQLITDNTVTIEALLPAESKTSEDINSGMFFAGELANSVNLGENVSVDFGSLEYYPEDDIVLLAQNLVDNGASAIIYSGNDYNTFKAFTAFIDSTEVPVISLCPYSYDADNFFSLTLSPEYLSSCVATYAADNDYINPLVIFESTNDYYIDFTDTIKKTFLSYTGKEPAIIHKLSGDTDTYSSYAEHDFVFLATSEASFKEDVLSLRNKGFNGEIMLSEIMDKSALQYEDFNNCSAISKFETDTANNVATVFSSMYSEAQGIGVEEISPAVAYGYDAFMVAFEGLKSFESKNDLIFGNTDATETTATPSSEIMLSDYANAISNVNYVGVTDIISFSNGNTNPTYIYVDNIIGNIVLFNKKYSFSS